MKYSKDIVVSRDLMMVMLILSIILLLSSKTLSLYNRNHHNNHNHNHNHHVLYSVNSRNLLDRLNHLSFGYERMQTNITSSSPPSSSSSSSSSSSLKPLCTDGSIDFYDLPCIKDNNCPYVRFRCSKGHRWNALQVDGPMCLECPTCKLKTKKINGITEIKLPINERLYPAIKDYCISNKGELLTSVEDIKGWVSDVHIKCNKGHLFKMKVNNLIVGNNWCSKCREVDYDYTAANFGGKFLGLIDNNNSSNLPKRRRPALWQCSEGHEFIEYVNNIRRSPQSKRKCSWCKICKKSGQTFIWENDKSKEMSNDITITKRGIKNDNNDDRITINIL